MKVKLLSRVRLSATPWTAAYQAPPSMGFSRQEYWSGVPSPSPHDLKIHFSSKSNNLTAILVLEFTSVIKSFTFSKGNYITVFKALHIFNSSKYILRF